MSGSGFGFREFVERAVGYVAYPSQERLADGGLPNLLRIPTGAGKTLAATPQLDDVVTGRPFGVGPSERGGGRWSMT
jgi:hypothetical protein